jgi:hypothetical protein
LDPQPRYSRRGARTFEECSVEQKKMGGPDALPKMELIIAFAVVFGIGFGVGYAVRERKSRMRRRRYTRDL